MEERVFLLAVLALLIGGHHCVVVVDIQPKEAVVRVGDNIKIMCKVPERIQYCRFELPNNKNYNLRPQSTPTDGGRISYYGASLESGQCGVEIKDVLVEYNGRIKCSMGVFSQAHEVDAETTLIVAKPPDPPELRITPSYKMDGGYKEGDSFSAVCEVKSARPAANISWFLEDVPVREGLSMPLITDVAGQDLFTVSQNITKTLTWADHGKKLVCVAEHIAMDDRNNQTSYQLNVLFSPKSEANPIEQYGYTLATEGSVTLEIHANPQPRFTWTVRNQEISEGRSDESGLYSVINTISKGNGVYETTLRIMSVSQPDIDEEFKVLARNQMGERVYTVKLSTATERSVIELETGAIIGIVLAILVVFLLIFLLIFARATGRWCFAGGVAPRADKESGILHSFGFLQPRFSRTKKGTDELEQNNESTNLKSTYDESERSDTESADHGPSVKNKKKSSTLTALFKKKKDKVSADVDVVKEPQSMTEKPVGKNPDGIVYAELDLTAASKRPVVRKEDEKTEYAEIICTVKQEDEKK